ncbi:MAG: glycoside hydrolase family 3 protein [Anaerolineae bacterium]|nr:glycoside hydrolase family 3 protein [Anaerolineae bacterium]
MRRNIITLLLFVLIARPAAAQTDVLASMTLEHKVAQMFMVTLHGGVLTEDGAALLREWQPGAVVLFAANLGDPAQVTRLTNGYQQTITEAGGPPLLIAVDQEGGVVARLTDGFTVFPAPVLTAAAGPEMSRQVGAATARELRAVGINMNLAPVADLETYRDNPIIFRRAWGSNPQLAGEAIAAFIDGSQAAGVLATAKHFPGHGETHEDSHAVLQTLDLSRERMAQVELVPFQAAIDTGVSTIMVAHIHYDALEPNNNLPASLDPAVVTDLLRGEMGFDGLVMTDAIDMNAIDMQFDFREAAVRAVEAGVDLIALGPSFGPQTQIGAMQAVIEAVRSGRISEAHIDEAVARILAAKARFGLLDWQPLDPATAAERVDAEAGTALIEALFRAGVTVAWDRADRVPVRPEQSVAVIFLATRYQIAQECGQYRSDIHWVGVGDAPSDEEIGWAVAAAAQADTVVVWTQDAIYNERQQALVNALPPEKTVAVALWSPYDGEAFPDVAAYIATYSPLRPAVPAACAILFGAQAATGRWVVGF